MNNDFSSFCAADHRLVDDSRQVRDGDIFICLPRAADKATQYCDQAVNAGAVGVVATREVFEVPPAVGVPFLLLDHVDAVGRWLRCWYQTEHTAVRCIGVTGTDGKTSVTWMLRESLQRYFSHSGQQAWSVGTLGVIRSGQENEALHNTTPSLLTNHRLLAEATEQNVAALVWEVSSHGIVQQRIAGLDFDTVVWTNLGHDHLEDHGGYEAYAQTKASFVRESVAGGAKLVCNLDQQEVMRYVTGATAMPHAGYQQLHEHGNKQTGCVPIAERSDMTVLRWALQNHTLSLSVEGETVCVTGLPPGRFHAENLSAAALVLHVQWDIPMQDLPRLLNDMPVPPGRMQQIDRQVFVDFAHTPEALESMLVQARDIMENEGKLKLVFGCGGNRDRVKRAQMGAVAARYADEIWLTSDNPRDENPIHILRDIQGGMDARADVRCHSIPDRQQAIEEAVAGLQESDLLIVAGKGHENYMEIAGQRLPWSDAKVIRQAFARCQDEQRCV